MFWERIEEDRRAKDLAPKSTTTFFEIRKAGDKIRHIHQRDYQHDVFCTWRDCCAAASSVEKNFRAKEPTQADGLLGRFPERNHEKSMLLSTVA
jgi:hypothetical protein